MVILWCIITLFYAHDNYNIVFICASHVLIVDVMPVDTNMIAVSWRVRYSDASLTSHFAIFDINSWYHAQMPKQVR